jgi:hypothetical protein
MRSTDGRFKNASADIWQHTVNNSDWEPDWVFSDGRFRLLNGPDQTFLRFLRETVHPVVRPDAEEAANLVDAHNDLLKPDGCELYAASSISGHKVYEARRVGVGPGAAIRAVRRVADTLDAEYLRQQIARMEESVESDPDLAIGTAKELLETMCKGILEQRGQPSDPNWEVSQLAKATLKTLGLVPEDVPHASRGAEAVRVLLGSLSAIIGKLAELRNLYGTGHGKTPSTKGLHPRHARLAVGAAGALATFLFETHIAKPPRAGTA